jgi:hypothetical protein
MEWNRVSALMALLCNINKDPKRGKTVYPAEFNPYIAADKKQRRNVIEVKDEESRRLFKEAFVGL